MATAPRPHEPALSLADHSCLSLIGEGPTHGWTLVKLLAPDGELGHIWSLSRPLTYRAIDRLVDRDLVTRADARRRAMLTATPLGRRRRRAWLDRPVTHLRDLRTEFLLKLALRDRAGLPRAPLVERQLVALSPTIDALIADDPSGPVEQWRRESALAAHRFLDCLAADTTPTDARRHGA